jgi:hypothetical protein
LISGECEIKNFRYRTGAKMSEGSKNKEALIENYNIFKAWIIDKVLLPKWKTIDKQKVLYDDDIDIIIEFCRDRKLFEELKDRLGVVSKIQKTKKDQKAYTKYVMFIRILELLTPCFGQV